MDKQQQVLVIDDNTERRHDLKIVLDFIGESSLEAFSNDWRKQATSPDELFAIIVGDALGAKELPEVLGELSRYAPHAPIMMIKDQGAPEVTDVLDNDDLEKIHSPFRYKEILAALQQCHLKRNNPDYAGQSGSGQSMPLFRSLVGSSPAIRQIRQLIEQVAGSDVTALISGEPGTGKEIAARNIHYLSSRRDKPFVPVNCAVISSELLESELFGHEKGAFAGALTDHQGRFELAEGGTLFLDEIGDLPLSIQVKLLRVLQDKCFERMGSNHSRTCDVRIITATHANLEAQISDGNFREDLYYLLNVFPIEMPALRDRAQDVPLLINELVTRNEGQGRPGVRIMPDAMMTLCQYNWPGNVRELANLVDRLAILHPNGIIDSADLPAKYTNADTIDDNRVSQSLVSSPMTNKSGKISSYFPALPEKGIDLKAHLVKTELAIINQALEETNWVVARAAKYLHMRRTTLVEKMRKHGISRPNKGIDDFDDISERHLRAM